MNIVRKTAVLCSIAALFSLALVTSAQIGNNVVLDAPTAAKVLPDAVFFAGQSANTQLRNAAGVHFADGAFTLAVLVDTSGYSTAVQQTYQGYLITETPLDFGGRHLVAGAYGFGFVGNRFMVMDIGNHGVLEVDSNHDADTQHPMPLRVAIGSMPGEYRLCSGRQCVSFHRSH
jgi:hypothetical protein